MQGEGEGLGGARGGGEGVWYARARQEQVVSRATSRRGLQSLVDRVGDVLPEPRRPQVLLRV